MLGTIANTAAIILGSVIGLIFKGNISLRYQDSIIKANGLTILLIGLLSATKTQDLMIVIFSMILGTLLGEWIDIEKRLEKLGDQLGKRFSKSESGLANAFVTASLVFCVGSMAIVGALKSGLLGDHQTLYAKAVLDGITSIIFASSMGIGVIFSAGAVFLYQGLITIAASSLKHVLIESVILEMSAVGGLLIMGLGFNLLEFKRIKVGNMLPAMFMPLIFYIIKLILSLA